MSNVKLGETTITNIDTVQLRDADNDGQYISFTKNGGASGGTTEFTHNFYIGQTPPEDKNKIWIKDSPLLSIDDITTGVLEKGPVRVSDLYTAANRQLGCLALTDEYLYIFNTDKTIVRYDLANKTSTTLSVTLTFPPDYVFAIGNNIYLCEGHKISKLDTTSNTVTALLTTFNSGFYDDWIVYPCWVLSNNKLYCFGGQYKTQVREGSIYVEYKHVTNRIYCYDLENGTSLGQVGTMPYSACSLAGCAVNGKIYVFGGMQTSINETSMKSAQGCTASAFSFDTQTKEVKSICSLPGKGYDGSAIYIGDDKILIAGCTMSEINYDATRMIIYQIDRNEYADTPVKFPTLMLNDNTYYPPAWCGLACASDNSAVYAAARSKVYKIDIDNVLEKNNIFVDCYKYGKKLKVASGASTGLYMPVKKMYLGNSDNQAVAKTCYSYVKKTVIENNYDCIQKESESGTTLTANITCGTGDRIVAAIAVRDTSTTLTSGWTILNSNWATTTKIESNSSAYAAQYTIFATKVATSTSESLTVTTSKSGRTFISLVRIKKNTNGTPSVAFNNVNVFNNITNGQNEFSVTRPSGFVIWYTNCVLYDNFSNWTSQDETQKCIAVWASRQAIFIDQNTSNSGNTVKFNSGPKATTAAIGSVTVTGIDDFWHDTVDGDLSGWMNIENGERYEG